MNLTNVQYEQLQREYSEIRYNNLAREDVRRNIVYKKIPGFEALEDEVRNVSVRKGREYLAGNRNALKELEREQAVILSKKKALLKENGFSDDYLDPIFNCPLCHDTGYIKDADGTQTKCRCMRDKEISILYDQSNIRELIKDENFSMLSLDYQTGEDLQKFEGALRVSKAFVNNFGSEYSNIIFYGSVGTGKSFLSGCIANEIIKKGYSVLYFSSVSFFDKISKYTFSGKDKAESTVYDDLIGCDLLIIDDLGTEMNNSFVTSTLLNIINERDICRKSTIISTNLDLEEIEAAYTTRVLSRIISHYNVCKLTGNDIRLVKKLGQQKI